MMLFLLPQVPRAGRLGMRTKLICPENSITAMQYGKDIYNMESEAFQQITGIGQSSASLSLRDDPRTEHSLQMTLTHGKT